MVQKKRLQERQSVHKHVFVNSLPDSLECAVVVGRQRSPLRQDEITQINLKPKVSHVFRTRFLLRNRLTNEARHFQCVICTTSLFSFM
jgi:hypothetical protein